MHPNIFVGHGGVDVAFGVLKIAHRDDRVETIQKGRILRMQSVSSAAFRSNVGSVLVKHARGATGSGVQNSGLTQFISHRLCR